MTGSRHAPVDLAAIGTATGVWWALAVVLLGVTARWGWGDRWRDLLSDVYRGYDSTPGGLVVGAIWAFVDGFVAASSLAWLYNRFQHPAAD